MTVAIGEVVGRAARRLGGLHVRAEIRRHLAVILATSAAGPALRPFVWPLLAAPPWQAALRAAALAAGAGALAAVLVIARAWRSRPSRLASARRLDHALALEEVVASGYAFERDGRDGELVGVARERARAALAGIDMRRLLRPAPFARERRGRVLLRASVALVLAALVFGGVDRLALVRLRHPVTSDERAAAAALVAAAEALEKDAAGSAPDDPRRLAAEAARRAAAATNRGDRDAAREALDDLRRAQRDAEGRERAEARELSDLRDALDGAGAAGARAGAAGRHATASAALAELGKAEPAELKGLAERLAKAEAAARAAAQATGNKGRPGAGARPGATASAWERAAAALAEARAAAERGDAAAAKAALARAEQEVRGLEARRGPGARGQASASAAALERSLERGQEARPGAGQAMAADGAADGEGEGEGQGSGSGPRDAPRARPGAGGPSRGGGAADHALGAPAPERTKVEGDLRVRADVADGEKAAGIIDGMGHGADSKDYRAIFPSYETAVEDGLREELVPARRRPAVRRYFESIRPADGEQP